MCGQDQALLQARQALGRIQLIHLPGTVHSGHFVIILAVFKFFLATHIAVVDPRRPGFAPDGGGVIQRNQDTVQPIGNFNRHRVERHAAHLLEVGELCDLLPIQPDFPTQTPRRDGGLFPVILYKTDIMLARVDTNGFE